MNIVLRVFDCGDAESGDRIVIGVEFRSTSSNSCWIASIIGVVLLNFHLFNVNEFEASVIFAVFILNLATNPRLHLREPRILAWFGQRTYGIYMWHYPIMAIFLTVAPGIGWPLLTLSMITFTLTVAAVSYRYFEHPFLRLKDRWQPMRYPRQSSNTISA